jgi:diguanylate cyclase (GGDEF)-like protein
VDIVSAGTDSKPDAGDVNAAVVAIWERFKGHTLERLHTLESVVVAQLESRLEETERRSAEREAHKLAGSLGTFGFPDGSRVAREIELALQGPLGPAETLRLSDLTVSLRRMVEQPPHPGVETETEVPAASAAAKPIAGDAGVRPLLLLIEAEENFARRVCADAETRHMRCNVATDPEEVRALLQAEAPDVVVMDLRFDGSADRGLALLAEVTRRAPSARVVVLSETAGYEERLDVARRGGRALLERPIQAARVVDMAADMLGVSGAGSQRVLVVAADAAAINAVRRELRGSRIEVEALSDPLRFWETLERTRPDLLILDADTPALADLAVCEVIRADPRWASLPVLYISRRTDAEHVQALFAAGADDCITRPFAGPELRARVETRLEHCRLQRMLSEVDPLTGVANRSRALNTLERLAHFGVRRREAVSLAVVDVDRLREINAEYGHAMGDAVLRRVARVLRAACGPHEIVGRWGGDQFVIGFFGTDRIDAVQRLRDALERLRAEPVRGEDGRSVAVTCGAGIAGFPREGAEVPVVARAAEDILAMAKKEGRGMVLPAGWTSEQALETERVDVVLVEDDLALAGLLSHTLETRGYRTRCFADGETAVEALCGEMPRLAARVIILDVDLPGRDGFSVLQTLAQDGITGSTRVVMLTVRATEPEVLKALEMGAFDHIGKPFSVQILMQRLRRALGA